MFPRTLAAPESSFFLLGPRGTGKSTWVREQFPTALRLDLLHEATFVELAGNAERIESLADGVGAQTVCIDEVQKLPSLLDEAHRLIEARGFRFVLTGSSARKLRRAGVNLLAGRARTLTMHPLTPAELGPRFDLGHALQFGLLPTAWVASDPADYLKSYAGTYLREEVMQESLVRNIGSFKRFLESASLSQAAILNMQAVATDCAVPRKTVETHFELVEDLLLGVRLPIFTRRAARKLVAHPKFFYFDTGVFRAIRPRGPLDSPAEIEGAALETLVFQAVRATSANLGLGYELYAWRTPGGDEVDLVAYGPLGLHAFEVKRSHRFHEKDLAGLRLFCEDYPEARGHLLYGGDRRYAYDQIEVLPVEEALTRLPGLLGSPPAPAPHRLE